MKVQKLLELIPHDLIESLEAETTVNHQVKKLHADIIFKLILYSMVEYNKVSLRIMESFAGSAKFRHLSGVAELETKYNSIRDRIFTIYAYFFHDLFPNIFLTYNNYLAEQDALVKVDSTVVGISSKLVSWTLSSGGTIKSDKKHLKYSVALKGSLPCSVKIYDTAEMASEDKALSELIYESKNAKGAVVVFDRGVQSRNVFDQLSSSRQIFVGRLRTGAAKINAIEELEIAGKPVHATVSIISDVRCKLYTRTHKETLSEYRIIKAVIDKSSEDIIFITNDFTLGAYDIAALYKQRWEIEVFFKFIKQHLNVSHLVSRNSNGIRVMIYMTLILSILLIAYKKLNRISSYKIANLRYSLELDNLMTKEIVILCGGDPARAPHLFNDP